MVHFFCFNKSACKGGKGRKIWKFCLICLLELEHAGHITICWNRTWGHPTRMQWSHATKKKYTSIDIEAFSTTFLHRPTYRIDLHWGLVIKLLHYRWLKYQLKLERERKINCSGSQHSPDGISLIHIGGPYPNNLKVFRKVSSLTYH